MFNILRLTFTYAALGGIMYVPVCVVAILAGQSEWMIANGYVASNILMVMGAVVGLAIGVCATLEDKGLR